MNPLPTTRYPLPDYRPSFANALGGQPSHFAIGMLPMYAEKCWGEGDMHDTEMLLGLLGWDQYQAPVEIVTPYFGSSGTGQINAIFPVTPLN